MVLPTRSIQLSVPDTDHVKRLKDPQAQSVFHLETWLLFSEAAKLQKGNANVRPASESRKPFKDMVSTVEEDPASFHIKNRGIMYLCERFEYDNAKRALQVTVPDITAQQIEEMDLDDPRFGIADGGHTYEVIQHTMNRLNELKEADPAWSEPYVRVHFIASQDPLGNIDEVVEALNTSSQVQQFTLDEYQNRFDELKRAMQAADFDISLIAFRENEEKDWEIREIIQRMACFLKDRWKNTQPSQIYRSKGKALDLFTSDSTGEFRRLFPVIRDIITLPEFIQAEFSRGDGPRKRFGGLRAVKPLKKPYTRAGTSYATDHVMDLAASLPIAAAFRELLELKDGQYQWKLDPKEVFHRCSEELYRALVSVSRAAKTVNRIGQDNEFWTQTCNIVLRKKDEMLSEKRE